MVRGHKSSRSHDNGAVPTTEDLKGFDGIEFGTGQRVIDER